MSRQHELAVRVLSALSEHGQTVAMAESLTGGLLCAALVEVPGASAVLRGGVVAYATELKHSVLGVDAALLADRGPVDPEVAEQMARGVRELTGADWGLSTTGVAGPGPQDGVPAGRAFIGLAGPIDVWPGSDPYPSLRLDLHGGRDDVRSECVLRALEYLVQTLGGASGGAAGRAPGFAEGRAPAGSVLEQGGTGDR